MIMILGHGTGCDTPVVAVAGRNTAVLKTERFCNGIAEWCRASPQELKTK